MASTDAGSVGGSSWPIPYSLAARNRQPIIVTLARKRVVDITRIRGQKNPLSAAALKSLRDEHTQTIEPARGQAGAPIRRELVALQLERRLSDLVNEAYGLTSDEVALIWDTAPPRMPFAHENP